MFKFEYALTKGCTPLGIEFLLEGYVFKEAMMRRRIIWRYGDSPPIFGHLIAAVEGDGELKIVVGFPVSAAEVAFSKIYNRFLRESLGYGYDSHAFAPEVFVSAIDDDGFTVCYRNIPESLDINFFVM